MNNTTHGSNGQQSLTKDNNLLWEENIIMAKHLNLVNQSTLKFHGIPSWLFCVILLTEKTRKDTGC